MKEDSTKADVPHAGPNALVALVVRLEKAYGWELLALLAVAQWLIKGVVWGFAHTTTDYLLRDYAVPGPKMQIYKAIVHLPWAMKPMFGLLSDRFPIMGYRKGPYIVITTIAAVAAYAAVGMLALKSLSVRGAVLCLAVGTMQASVADLLTEACYAEKIRERPEYGPDLMTYVWGGITVGNLLATSVVGIIIERFGSTTVYCIVAVLAGFMLVPVALGWLQEKRISSSSRQHVRTELVVLVVITGAASVAMMLVGLLQDSIWVNVAVALGCSVVVLIAFSFLLSPIISLMNCFFFLQTCAAIDISGASFYFFTDDAAQYPDGPHFSKVFFASGLGLCVGLLNLVGMYIYNRYMQHWRYHGLFLFANSVLCVINLACILVYTRTNVALGIPDMFFVAGAWGAVGVASTWMWIPGIVLLSQMCPRGVEATMYALLAGCHNLGIAVASYIGACVLHVLNVAPRGEVGEQRQFDNLWVAALISAVLPMFTMALLPWMIPNAKQTEILLEPGSSPVTGAPFTRCFGREHADETERDPETSSAEPLSTATGSPCTAYGATTEHASVVGGGRA